MIGPFSPSSRTVLLAGTWLSATSVSVANPMIGPKSPSKALRTFGRLAVLGGCLLSLNACKPESPADQPAAPAAVVQPALDPSSPLAKARALKAEGKLDEARELLAQAATGSLDDVTLHREYQDLLRATHKVEEGRAFYQKRLDENKASANAWYLYGRSLIREAPAEAEVAFRKALELNDGLEWAWLGLGTVQSLRNDGFAAVQVYEKALERFPQSANVYFNLADARKNIGALRTGLEAGEKAVQLDPSLAKAWELIGLIQQQQGDGSSARKSLERALSVDPSLPISHLALAEVLVNAGELEQARTHAQAGVALGKPLTDALKLKFPELASTPPATDGATSASPVAPAQAGAASPPSTQPDSVPPAAGAAAVPGTSSGH